ncbi:MAG: methyltransferase domain-containing protein [Deltaproteobacteria bacterium]|nr:methyltransferase domain-containing protein [Deltaproteobacteria bacterium]
MPVDLLTKAYRWLRDRKRKLDRYTRWPPLGALDWGDLRRLNPVSKNFGLDRGQPIDRYYIEKFLSWHALDIRGRVLEIGDPRYTRQFGGDRVTRSDVLHVNLKKPDVTIVGDLATGDQLPTEAFDCLILTQTLQVIFDVRAAVGTCYRILKPGGVLLATFPGLSRVARPSFLETWKDTWRFTKSGAERLFREAFPSGDISVTAFGNVLAAVAFLHGLAAEELLPEELEATDPDFEVLLAVRAVKSQSAPQEG